MQYLTAILFSLKGRMTHTKMFLALVSIFCTTGIDERQKHFRVGCIKKSASLYIFFLECPTTCMYKDFICQTGVRRTRRLTRLVASFDPQAPDVIYIFS